MGRKNLHEKYKELMDINQQMEETVQIKAISGYENLYISLIRENFTPAILRLGKIGSIRTIEDPENMTRSQKRNGVPGKTRIVYDGKELFVQEPYIEILKKIDDTIRTRRRIQEQENEL